jgi:hypothetical protein
MTNVIKTAATPKQTIETILNNETYKQVLKDSFGGIMYQEGTQKNYNSSEVLKLWESLPGSYKESTGGITRGVFGFLQSK